MSDEMDELPDLDALMRAERKHDWMSEPRFKRMFDDIEDGLQGVLGKGRYEWVDRRVFDQVFDRSTLLAIHKLLQKGGIETIDYPIARGKEAHVFHATTNHGPVAVKIFHTTNAVFKGLAKYIDGDPRFSGLSRRHRELVNIWVRKELRNLKRMRRHGLRVPEPIDSLKNILVSRTSGKITEPPHDSRTSPSMTLTGSLRNCSSSRRSTGRPVSSCTRTSASITSSGRMASLGS